MSVIIQPLSQSNSSSANQDTLGVNSSITTAPSVADNQPPSQNRFLKIVKFPLAKVKNIALVISRRSLPLVLPVNRKKVFLVIFLLLGGFSLAFFYQGTDYFKAVKPSITLMNPKEDQIVKKSELYISGSVVPINSQITVNGKAVSENGNGNFTSVIDVSEGKNIIKVEAVYRGSKSEIVRLVDRQLTESEIKQKEIDKQQALTEQKERILGVDQKIEELLATYNSGQGLNTVRVVNHQIQKELNFQRVTGQVMNNSASPVYWVKITCIFYGPNEEVVDTKYGLAVSQDAQVAPGESADFKTQSTIKEFHHYKLSVEWKSEASLTMTPTPAPQVILEPSPTINSKKIIP